MTAQYLTRRFLAALLFFSLAASFSAAGDPRESADVTVRLLNAKEDTYEGGFIVSMTSKGTLWNLDGYKIEDKGLAEALRRPSKGDSDKTRTLKVRVKDPAATSLATIDKVLDRIKKAAEPGAQTRVLLIIDPEKR